MSPEETVKYLNERYTINGAFYWGDPIKTQPNKPLSFYTKLVPSSQRDVKFVKVKGVSVGRNLYDFGIGSLHRISYKNGEYEFFFYRLDLLESYGYETNGVRFEGTSIDEVMNAVVAYIIVNGMCDLRHKDLT